MDRWISALEGVTQRLEVQKPDYVVGSKMFKAFSDLSRETCQDLAIARRSTSTSGLRRFYASMEDIIREYGDLFLVGASLLDARSQNRTTLASGLVNALISEDAKHLAAPIGSLFELESRIASYLRILNSTGPLLAKRMKEAGQRLYDETGINLL